MKSTKTLIFGFFCILFNSWNIDAVTNDNADQQKSNNLPDFFPSSKAINCSVKSDKIDALLLFDISDFGDGAKFIKRRQIITTFINSLFGLRCDSGGKEEQENLRIGIIKFSDSQNLILSLSNGTDKFMAIKSVENIEPSGNKTIIYDALRAGFRELEANGRLGAIKIILLITDKAGNNSRNKEQLIAFSPPKVAQQNFYAITSSPECVTDISEITGAYERVFMDYEYNKFFSTIAQFLNECQTCQNSRPLNTTSEFSFDGSIGSIETPKIEKSLKREKSEAINFRARILEPQKMAPKILPADCLTDVSFIFDSDNKDHTKIASDIVKQVHESDINSKKVKFEYLNMRVGDQTNASLGITKKFLPSNMLEAFIQKILSKRRSLARLLVVLFLSTDDSDYQSNKDFLAVMKNLHSSKNTELFVVSFPFKGNKEKLNVFTQDKWHLYINARALEFVNQFSKTLLFCTLSPSKDVTLFGSGNLLNAAHIDHEPVTSIERVEHLEQLGKIVSRPKECNKDPIDITFLVDYRIALKEEIAESQLREFNIFKKLLIDSIKQMPSEDYQKRIRFAIFFSAPIKERLEDDGVFVSPDRTTISNYSQAPIDRDEILFAIERIEMPKFIHNENSNTTASIFLGLEEIIKGLKAHKRDKSRILISVITNGLSIDTEPIQNKTLDADRLLLSRKVRDELAELNATLLIMTDPLASKKSLPQKHLSDRAERITLLLSDEESPKNVRVFGGKRQINGFLNELLQNMECHAFKRRNDELKIFHADTLKHSPGQKIAAPTRTTRGTVLQQQQQKIQRRRSMSTEMIIDNEVDLVHVVEAVAEHAISQKSNKLEGQNLSSTTIPIPIILASLKNETESLQRFVIGKISDSFVEGFSEAKNESVAEPTTGKKENTSTPLMIGDEKQREKIREIESSTSASKKENHSLLDDLKEAGKDSNTLTDLKLDQAPQISFLNDQCKVDLMFIIDTSQSVAQDFHKQLQFAVDLVKRLPDVDFANRIQIGAVSFQRSATIQFPLGELKDKSAILDALFAIKHTGGSTSVVSGVELAIKEIERARRNNTRLMVVLLTDGNSQDSWEMVLSSAENLRKLNSNVFVVSVGQNYFFRELELYAGNKWLVYIDARIRQFLTEAETSLTECTNPTVPLDTRSLKSSNFPRTPSTSQITATPIRRNITEAENCSDDFVDLIFVLDTSTSVERDFYAEKNFALNLVKVLPEEDFDKRVAISMIKFNSNASLQFSFEKERTRNDVLYAIERVEHTGGQTSLVAGIELAMKEIRLHGRSTKKGARSMIVIISDGNSQDEWQKVQETAQKLRRTKAATYAVTLSHKYYFDELKEYTGSTDRVYTEERIDQFIEDVGKSIITCFGKSMDKNDTLITMASNVEISVTPPISTLKTEDLDFNNDSKVKSEFRRDEASIEMNNSTNGSNKPPKLENETKPLVLRDSQQFTGQNIDEEKLVVINDNIDKQKDCKYAKMDLILILDASTSREAVFEHQRELALSLIERLPISSNGIHVATGVNSFTDVPTLRQTLGLGRDRNIVRQAIEDIKYQGGSTLTSKAVELAIEDLERGRRQDAVAVVVNQQKSITILFYKLSFGSNE